MEYESFHSIILEAAEKGDLKKFKHVVEETKENLKKIRKTNSALALDAAANFHGGLMKQAPLHVACSHGRIEIVKYLLEKDVITDIQDVDGAQPLHCAANNGHVEVVKLLLSKGANPIIRESQADDTPLHWACVKGHLEVVKVLLTAMTPMMQDAVNHPNKVGMTPLHFAAGTGQVEIVEYLCNEKANVNKQDKDGNTPLHLACANLHLNVADLLVTKYHPQLDIKNTVSIVSACHIRVLLH